MMVHMSVEEMVGIRQKRFGKFCPLWGLLMGTVRAGALVDGSTFMQAELDYLRN